MKTITKSVNAISIVLFFLLFNASFSQGALRETPLKQQVDQSAFIVEGKVVSKRSFWDANRHNIYTSSTVEVYKVFKGETIKSIEVITPGGSVGNQAEVVSPSLRLRKGDTGIFMLTDMKVVFSDENRSSLQRFSPYGSVQGFYKYNLSSDVAANPFNKKQGISDSFYKEIMNFTGLNYIEVTPFDTKKKASGDQKKNAFAPGSITFAPTSSTAGTASPLVVSGTGFGATQGSGKVSFRDADDGGAGFVDAIDSQILAWSDTEITVEIPDQAGTGTIMVTNDDTSTGESVGILTITHAQLNVVADIGAGDTAFPLRHVDNDGSGGYVWEMYEDFDDGTDEAGAKDSFIRALDTWRCETGVNWTIGAVNTVDDVIANDDINIIRFDNGAELPVDVLGRCTSRLHGCGTGPGDWDYYVEEMDIAFDDGTLWETGPAMATGSEYDFESVALHELGHGHQLGHVIEPTGAVMHYALANSENIRILTADDIAGASDVQSRSEGSTPFCFDYFWGITAGMTPYGGVCPPPLGLTESELSAMIIVYPNPNKGNFFIDKTASINLTKLEVYDLHGRLVSEQDLSNALNTKTISLKSVSSGVYFANIHSDLGILTKKLIVK